MSETNYAENDVRARPAAGQAIAAVRAAPLLSNPVDRIDQAEAVVPSNASGVRFRPKATDGLFSQSWFPICLASDVANGAVKGYDFLDGRVVVWRAPTALRA